MKPSLVFMSPAMPSFSGNGLAMRAAHNLRALAEEFTVHLLVIAMHGGHEGVPDEEVSSLCKSWSRINVTPPPAKPKSRWRRLLPVRDKRIVQPPEWTGFNPTNEAEALSYFSKTKCVRVWMFRFYLLPWVSGWLERGGKVWLDIDESEARARQRSGNLHMETGREKQGNLLKNEARIYSELENRHLHRFERIVTASDLESEGLRKIPGVMSVETWPNIVTTAPSPTLSFSPPTRDRRYIGFIGSLGHFPNRDAIQQAIREVLPRIRAMCGHSVTLIVAGAGANVHRNEFARLDGIEWMGTVPDVSGFYANVDVIIVPLRTGGGTRIKILEAFSHRKAVVSTAIGAEGLDVRHGRELLLADEPDEMAACCARLLEDANERERLAAAGHAFVISRHGADALKPKAAALSRLLSAETPVAELRTPR